MPEFTVVAIYDEPFGQRFAETYEADSPKEAETLACGVARDQGTELIVAGVIAGRHQMADTYTDGTT